MNVPVAQSDIEKFRTPSEFLKWIQIVSHHVKHEVDEELLFRRKDLYKQLHEEVFPLAQLLEFKLKDWSESRFRNLIGPQNYDIEIQSSDFPLDYLEVSCACFDDDWMFRILRYLDGESVSLSAKAIREGKIMKSGKRKVTAISALPRESRDFVSEVVNKVTDRITQKAAKDYPDRTGLIVYYDDLPFKSSDYELIRLACRKIEVLWRNTFDSLFILGTTNTELIEI